jgi:hypothetical protein
MGVSDVTGGHAGTDGCFAIANRKGSSMSNLIEQDLTAELWREYDFQGRTYRIDNPQRLFMRNSPDCTTHRVLDSAGVLHLLPAPGRYGCVVRWQPRDSEKPVQF